MKAVFVVYNDAIDPEVSEMLEKAGIEYFTKFTGVLGKGPGSGARLGDSVWPGGNMAVMAIVEPETAAKVVEEVKRLQDDIPAEGLRVMWWGVEGMA